MANQIPVKAIYSGSDVTSLGEFASSDSITATYLPVGTGSTDVAAGDHTHATYLPLAGGAMTGAITTNSTFDGVDIATRDAILTSTTTTANAALPLAGGTISGSATDFEGLKVLNTNSSNSTATTTTLLLGTTNSVRETYSKIQNVEGGVDANETDLVFSSTSSANVLTERLRLKHTGVATFANSVTAKTDTDATNTGSVTLDFAANQNFVLTLTGNVTLANPTTEQVGQSGFIAFIQDGTGSRTVGLGTDYETAGAVGLTLTATASATDLVPYLVVASGRILLGTPQLAFA